MPTYSLPRNTSHFMGRRFTRGVIHCATMAAAVTAAFLGPNILNGQDEPTEPISFFDDFESYSDWDTLESPWIPTTPAGYIFVVKDDEDLFGQGTSNLIADYSKTSAGDASYSQIMLLENEFSVEVGRMSFDFVRPDDGSTDTLWAILQVGNRNSKNRAQVFTIGGDAIHGIEYARGSVHHIEFVFNNSNDSIQYGEGNILAPGRVDIWLNGELKHEGFAAQNDKRGAISTLEFNSAGSRIHQFLFDNIRIEPIEWETPPPAENPEPQVILHENFSSHTEGELPGEPWTEVTDDPVKTGSALIQKDSTDRFGKGVDNHYMEYIANGDGAIVARSESSFDSDLITFSVRLINPTPEGALGYSWFIFNVGNVSGANNRAQVITLDNRTNETTPEGHSRIGTATYPQNVPVQIDLIMNNRPVSVEYGDGQIIESGKTDIWVNGKLGRSGFASQNKKLGPISSFELNVSGSRIQHLLIDEITIYDSARVSTVPTEGGFATWRAEHFPDDAQNDEISGPEADPSGDGVPNLLKYVLGLDPIVVSREGLPITETRNIDDVDYLTISFDRPTDLDAVSHSVLATSDLSAWNDQAILVEMIDNGDGTVTEVWRDSEALDSSGARFLRLEVSIQ